MLGQLALANRLVRYLVDAANFRAKLAVAANGGVTERDRANWKHC